MRKRYYYLDTSISKGKFGNIMPTNYVLVSDSLFNNERLVFAIYFLPGFNESAFSDGSSHFLKVDKAHLMGSLLPINSPNKELTVPTDDRLLCDLESYNGTNS